MRNEADEVQRRVERHAPPTRRGRAAASSRPRNAPNAERQRDPARNSQHEASGEKGIVCDEAEKGGNRREEAKIGGGFVRPDQSIEGWTRNDRP